MICLPWQLDCGFGNPRCIPKKKLHDGKIDCYSGLDEGCPSHYFVCKDKSTCIEPELFQDGKRHCADGSDERESLCKKKKKTMRTLVVCASPLTTRMAIKGATPFLSMSSFAILLQLDSKSRL
ncbi:hypothetical protein ANCDUO_01714 [Ancylostoma duodenale]|uniref:Low-density lipoprotein receptor domain class A n=1 Tax=Ancylostoma duodenale TaxID=51022 RepID=A0A0C2HEI8_9BILA|nr:hypothetical protein ANCDUO_01714 [Ancylostoma duodenale]